MTIRSIFLMSLSSNLQIFFSFFNGNLDLKFNICGRVNIIYQQLTSQKFSRVEAANELPHPTEQYFIKHQENANYCPEDQSKPGQSSRGVSRRQNSSSKVPAHASLFVKKFDFRLKSFFTVAGIDECSNCEYANGPTGSWITTPSNTRVNPETKAQNSQLSENREDLKRVYQLISKLLTQICTKKNTSIRTTQMGKGKVTEGFRKG